MPSRTSSERWSSAARGRDAEALQQAQQAVITEGAAAQQAANDLKARATTSATRRGAARPGSSGAMRSASASATRASDLRRALEQRAEVPSLITSTRTSRVAVTVAVRGIFVTQSDLAEEVALLHRG